MSPKGHPADAQATCQYRPSRRDQDEGVTAQAVSGGDGCGGSLEALAGADRAALPEGWAEGRAAADAAGHDFAHLLPTELVCAERSDVRRDTVPQ